MIASDRLFGTSISRWLAVFAAALLALTLLPATTAIGQEVDDPEDACPEDPPPAPYTDRLDIPEVHVRNVDCVTHRNIALGFADNTYRPTLPVPRDQMASFIARTLDEAGFMLPGGGPPPEFDDIAGNTHEENINRLARAGIVLGGPGDLSASSYGPRLLVRRDQMASFLIRAAEWALDQSFGEPDQRFPDVPPGNPHFQNVNGAHETGLTVGRVDGTYGPADSTRRDQMASFLARLLNFLETFEPEPEPTPEPTPEPPVETFTDAPEIIGCELVSDDGDDAVVRATFDDEITTTIDETDFFVVRILGFEELDATDAIRDPDDSTSALVAFVSADVSGSTVCAVENGAVQDADGNLNPEGSAPLSRTGAASQNFPAGATIGPDLVEVTDFNVSDDRATFVFNAPTDLGAGDGALDFGIVRANGTRENGVDVQSVSDGGRRVVVNFPGGTFTSAGATSPANVRRGFLEGLSVAHDDHGFDAPHKVVDVTQNGVTALPDLTGAVFDEEDDEVTLTFNEAISGGPALTPADFELWDVLSTHHAGPITPTGATYDGTNRVVLEFDENEVNKAANGIFVDAGAVTGDVSGDTNEVGFVGRAANFAAGETVRPMLIDVERRVEQFPSPDDVVLRLRYNEDVDLFAGGAFLYQEDGERSDDIEPDCDDSATHGGDDDLIICTFPDGHALFSDAASAVLIGFENEFVDDIYATEYESYADSMGIS